MMNIYVRLFLAVALASILTACGGGGSNPPADPPPAADTQLDWDDDNWDERNWQ